MLSSRFLYILNANKHFIIILLHFWKFQIIITHLSSDNIDSIEKLLFCFYIHKVLGKKGKRQIILCIFKQNKH